MSGIRPRVTLPAEALAQPWLAPHQPLSEEDVRRFRRARRWTRAVLAAGLLLMLAGVVEVTAAPIEGLALAGFAPLVIGLAVCAVSESRLSRIVRAERAAQGLPPGRRQDDLGWWHFSGWESGGGHTRHDSCAGGLFGGGFDGGGGGDGGGGC